MSNVNTPGADARIGGTFASSFNIASHLGGQLNIPELILAIQVERGQILDNQIKDQMEEMQKRNATLRELNAAMSALRGARPDGKPDTKKDISNVTFTGADGTPKNAVSYLQGLGVNVSGGDISQTKWDDNIANIKTAVDSINNQSQMDMVRLQGLMDKRNQAFDMMTNTISKSGKSLDGIIGNMR
jgi:hypothetical protein